jgi:hypothetical protein
VKEEEERKEGRTEGQKEEGGREELTKKMSKTSLF